MATSITKAIQRIKDTAENNASEYHKSFAVTMLQQIARDTPVDTGRATANWILKEGAPNVVPKNLKDTSKTATITGKRARQIADKAKPLSDLYISNAVQGRDDGVGSFNGQGYIIGLERGKSVQAPAGMMFSKNVASAKLISKKALNDVGL